MKQHLCNDCYNLQKIDESGINGYCDKCGSENLIIHEQHKAKITLHDKDYFFTRFNGTKKQIKDYYMNNYFNFGTVGDKMKKVVKVEFIIEEV